MADDGTITIGFDVPIEDLVSDVKQMNKILSGVGKDTGKQMESSFKENSEKVKQTADNTDQHIKNKLGKTTKVKVGADTNEADAKIKDLDEKKRKLSGETKVKVNADTNEANRKIRDFNTRTAHIPKEHNTKLTVTDHISNILGTIRGKSKETESSVGHLGSIIKGTFIGSLASNAVTSVWSHLTGWIGRAISAGKDYALEQQTMLASWTTLTGSARKGQAMVDMTNKMALAANNSTKMVDQLNQKLYAVTNSAGETGKLTKSILTLQDAFGVDDAAIANFSVQYSQMIGNGKAQAMDLMSIQNVFPKFKQELLEYMQLQTHNHKLSMEQLNDMISHGKITSDIMNNVLIKMGKKYAGATENFSKTIPGMIRTIKSTVPVLLGQLTQPFAKAANPIIGTITNWITSKKTKGEFEKLGITSAHGLNIVVNAFAGEGSDSKKLINNLNSGLESLDTWLIRVFHYIADHAKDIKQIGKDLWTVATTLGKDVWNDFATIIADIAEAIGLTGDNSGKAETPLKRLEGVLHAIATHKEFIQAVANAIVAIAAIKTMNKVLSPLKDIAEIKIGSHSLLGWIGKGGLKLLTGLIHPVSTFKSVLSSLTNIWDKSLIRLSNGATRVHKIGQIIGKVFSTIGKGISFAGKNLGRAFLNQLKIIGRGVKGLGKIIWNSAKWASNEARSAGRFLASEVSKGFKASVNLGKGLFGKGEGAGRLNGLLQSSRSAGGFRNLSAAGKVGTIAAGAGVAINSGIDIYHAIKDKVGSRKQYEDIGKGAGSAIGGGIGLYFGGPLGAAVGAKIGEVVGKWGGDAVKNFQNGWNKKKPPKKFWSLENLGWSTHDTFNKIGKWGSDLGKKFGKGIHDAKSFTHKNSKELALTVASPLLGIPALLYKNNSGFRKWIDSLKKGFEKFHPIKDIQEKIGGFKFHWPKIRLPKFKWPKIRLPKLDVKGWLAKMGAHIHKFKFPKLQAPKWPGWNKLKRNVSNTWNDMVRTTKKKAGSLWSNAKGGMESLRKGTDSFLKSIKNGWHSMWNGLAKWFGGVWDSIKKKASGGINGVVDIINGGISGINGLIHDFGGKSNTIGKISHVKLATGTGAFSGPRRPITQRTLALLNDGVDSPETNNQEMIWDRRSGSLSLVPGVNTLRWLEPGQEVFSAKETAALLGATHFAKGTGVGGFLSGIGDWAKGVWNGAVNAGKGLIRWFKEAMNIVSHPSQALDAIFKFKDSGFKGLFTELAPGMFKTAKKGALSWWNQLWSMVGGKLNDGGATANSKLVSEMMKLGEGKPYVWGATGPSAYDCSGLVMAAAKKLGVDLPRYSGSQFNATVPVSHPQPGDLVFFGHGGSAHVGGYMGKDTYYSAQSPSAGIGVGKISAVHEGPVSYRRIKGLSQGSSKKDSAKGVSNKRIYQQVGNGFWKFIGKLADLFGDHMANPSGDGVQRWRPAVKRALSMLHLSGSLVNKVLAQIATESSGNPHAMGGTDGLNDGHAMGLMQVKPGTFAAYKLRGHNNIWNGFDNLLAGLNYAKHRYGSNLYYLGQGHGYRNGGKVFTPEIASIAEDGTEYVINPDKPSFDNLMKDAIHERAQKYPDGLAAKMDSILNFDDLRYSSANGYRWYSPNSSGKQADGGTQIVKNVTDRENQVKGNVNMTIQLDSDVIARKTYPKSKIMQSKEINIAQMGGAIPIV